MKIGDRIKQRRKLLGMTVDELAEKLQKNRATIYRYESSEIEKLPTTVLEPLAVALKTTPSYLMGWEDENPAEENQQEHRPEISDDDIKFALWGGAEGITEEMYEEVRQYAEMVKMREERKNNTK